MHEADGDHEMHPVSFVRANDSIIAGIKEAVEKSIKLVNFNFNNKVNRIVIKPNMCYYYHPSTGEVTDPKFVSALIDVLRENFASNPEISVVESDATAMKCKYVFKMLGYDKLAEEKKVGLANLSEEKTKQMDIEINGHSLTFSIAEMLLDCDLLVNVPKIKYMPGPKITCALKNIFGCNAYYKKSIYHTALSEAIVGINKLVRTNLVVVDGLIVNGKNTKHLNLVMASEDPVSVDAAASKLLGINPESVEQIVLASKEHIGTSKFSPVGDFAFFQKNFPRKRFGDKVLEVASSAYLKLFHKE